MVGEEPAALRSPGLEQATIHAPIPTLVFQGRGKIRQLISVRSAPSSYQVWALTFQAGGKLLSATRAEHPIDRTPLVLNAANTGSPSVPTTPAPRRPRIRSKSVSAEPAISTPVTPEPTTSAPAAATAASRIRADCSHPPRRRCPLRPHLLATAEAAKPPALPTPPPTPSQSQRLAAPTATASANAEVSQPPSPRRPLKIPLPSPSR